ncbi:MAG: hypothetical protein EXQ56_03990 [Acidobacteria bacterium]|nr:hypothetical protein [Acidobacteriota bacterium]
MTCIEFNRLFEELEDQTALPADLQNHRQGCRTCGEMVDDIIYLARQARVLRPMQAPSDRVWRNIQATLVAEGVIRSGAHDTHGDSAAKHGGASSLPMHSIPRRAPMGMAYAAMFSLAAGVMYFQSLFTGGGRPPMLVAHPQLPSIPMVDAVTAANSQVAQISPTETEIAATDIDQMAASIPEEHRATMVSTWHDEVSTYRNLSDFIGLHPEDPFLRGQLMNSQQRLELIMEKFASWNDNF